MSLFDTSRTSYPRCRQKITFSVVSFLEALLRLLNIKGKEGQFSGIFRLDNITLETLEALIS